ncbi:splicing factor, Prp19-binding domain-containing protein [Tricladium varicosporioides]|nr:splicing factor, Prp19-binding domain-containing protein [Hymenoscyphus varicosporioides]
MPPKRMTANPVKAPRYRPGKALAEEQSSSEDESEDETRPTTASKPIAPPPKASTAAGITSHLNKVDLNERRKLAIEKEAKRIEEEKALKAKEEEGFVTASEQEESEEEEDGSEESSEEESSEEEAPRRVMMRPTFIKKDKRGANSAAAAKEKSEEELIAADEARRKQLADEIVEEQIRKDIAAKEAGKRNWDDDEDEGDGVDDTDDLDPEAEYAAWKLRELRRIKRDREAIEERERELEEIERRKNLTEEERKAEDDVYLAAQKEEKDSKGKMAYMQKYYHKGAFFQDDLKAEGLDRRDIMGSRFADDVQNRDLLPQALQMRDMTKLGKKGATKYKDLKSEDTGRWGQFDDRPRRGGQFGVDERFMPDERRGGPGASGSNNIPVGERKKVVGAPEGPRDMSQGGGRKQEGRREEDVDSYRPSRRRDSSRHRRSSRERYRGDRRRKRSTSRDYVRHESDKRRRVDSR